MAPHTLTKASDFPLLRVLRVLAHAINAARPDEHAPRVLTPAKSSAAGVPLGPCRLLHLSEEEDFGFVLSQSRSDGAWYLTVTGRREAKNGPGKKSTRSTQPWPRTPKTDALRPVSLHRWICFAMHGEPPSETCDAAHACDNTDCVCGAHLFWQERVPNRKKAGRDPLSSPQTARLKRRRPA